MRKYTLTCFEIIEDVKVEFYTLENEIITINSLEN